MMSTLFFLHNMTIFSGVFLSVVCIERPEQNIFFWLKVLVCAEGSASQGTTWDSTQVDFEKASEKVQGQTYSPPETLPLLFLFFLWKSAMVLFAGLFSIGLGRVARWLAF